MTWILTWIHRVTSRRLVETINFYLFAYFLNWTLWALKFQLLFSMKLLKFKQRRLQVFVYGRLLYRFAFNVHRHGYAFGLLKTSLINYAVPRFMLLAKLIHFRILLATFNPDRTIMFYIFFQIWIVVVLRIIFMNERPQ